MAGLAASGAGGALALLPCPSSPAPPPSPLPLLLSLAPLLLLLPAVAAPTLRRTRFKCPSAYPCRGNCSARRRSSAEVCCGCTLHTTTLTLASAEDGSKCLGTMTSVSRTAAIGALGV